MTDPGDRGLLRRGGSSPRVAVVMGSRSDWPTMEQAAQVLAEFDVAYEARVVSAHRTPDWMVEFASGAEQRGIAVIIAAAGGAAHLPGMVAAHSVLPVLGVPIQSKSLSGLDSLLSMVQMPKGIPVGTLAIGGCRGDQRGAAGGVDPRRRRRWIAGQAARIPNEASPRRARGRSDMKPRPILPGATLGLFGGGQLGRMFALACTPPGLSRSSLRPRRRLSRRWRGG
jgi:5-(carboxyamino)imidazole ribonucleotide mutase